MFGIRLMYVCLLNRRCKPFFEKLCLYVSVIITGQRTYNCSSLNVPTEDSISGENKAHYRLTIGYRKYYPRHILEVHWMF